MSGPPEAHGHMKDAGYRKDKVAHVPEALCMVIDPHGPFLERRRAGFVLGIQGCS